MSLVSRLAFHIPVQDVDTVMAPTRPQHVPEDEQRAGVLVGPPLHQHQEAGRLPLNGGADLKVVDLLSGEAQQLR